MFETTSRETTPKGQQTKTVKRFKLRNNSFCAVTSPFPRGLGGSSAMKWILAKAEGGTIEAETKDT